MEMGNTLIGIDPIRMNMAREISQYHCMNAQLIYEWSEKHNVDLRDYKNRLTDHVRILRANDALWNDITYDRFDKVKRLR